ncbi:hypothetical protein D915_010299 [Fasciola hepatica]|uniref:Uncharacterized protein n=1 Tax=Fasciola hepatica TaxID=6192 RepID=A0A4E0RAG9_FASHE|nr:hypothetical protein D915_010299 [Fasciola hepatica]
MSLDYFPSRRLWPHRTFRRVARVSSSVSRPGGITRPVRRRGRSRGRHRGPNTDFGSVNSRASNKSLMKVSRGRPSGGGSRSRIQGHPRRRGMNLVGRPRIHGRYTKPELRSTLKEENESGTESINSIADSPIKSPTNYSKSRERRQSYLSRNDDECVNFDFTHRWSETSKGVDAPEEDLDRDTEPECGSDQKTISSLDQLSVNSRSRTIVSPKCTPLDDADQRDVSSKENSSAHTPGIEKLPRLERENRKLSRPRNQGTDVVERRKRRTSGEGTAHSPPLRKNISSEESKKKSREEIWMDEVLRRIERMEKKQLQQQKQRPGADKHETEEMSGISAPSMSQAGSESVHDISAKPKSDQGPLESVSDIALSVVKPVDEESQTSDMQIASSPSHRAKLHINTIDGLKPETLSEKKMYDTEDAFMKGSDKQSEPRTSISPRSPTKLSDSSKSRMKQKQSGSAVQSKRRRSQTTFLPDNFCTSIERRDSREDRWLKSQLRRIAELEDQPDGSQKESDHTTPIDALTNGSDTSTTSQADDFSLGHTRDLSHEVPVPEACQSDVHMIYQETHRRCPHSSPEGPSPEPFSSSNNQPPASNSKDQDSEADCTLIVYRTREKDPMAKFSRNRKTGLGLGTATGDVPINTVCENNENDMKMACSYPTLTTSTPSTHSAPRPTKKRWLSQAFEMTFILKGDSRYIALEDVLGIS